MTRTSTRPLLTVALAAVASLLLQGTAVGAHPLPGKSYSGFTSESGDYKAPVTFRVSDNGSRLLRFTWAGLGCLGGGGPGNPYADPYNNYKLGRIKVRDSGRFVVEDVRTTNDSQTPTKITVSTVHGHFKTATKAVGTIDYTMRFTGEPRCRGSVTFVATH